MFQFINDQSFSASSERDMAPVSLPVSSSRQMDLKAKPKVKCKGPRPMRRSMILIPFCGLQLLLRMAVNFSTITVDYFVMVKAETVCFIPYEIFWQFSCRFSSPSIDSLNVIFPGWDEQWAAVVAYLHCFGCNFSSAADSCTLQPPVC